MWVFLFRRRLLKWQKELDVIVTVLQAMNWGTPSGNGSKNPIVYWEIALIRELTSKPYVVRL